MTLKQYPYGFHNAALSKIHPAYRFDNSTSFSEWQKNARARLITLMGLDRIAKASEDMFEIEYEREFDAFIEYRFRFQSEENYFVPCHLWIPKGVIGKIPLVICLQGHSKGFHISLGRPIYPDDENTISGGDRDFAVQIIKQGYCALAIEQRAFGECGGTPDGPDCTGAAMTAIMYGRTLLAERVFDISRAIDVVTKNFSTVNADRIACMGNSGGGTATIYASAIDERIKISMPSCALCTYKDSIAAMNHCPCNYIPNIALDFDMGDLCGLIAPRKLVVVSGAKDFIFPHHGVKECIDVLSKYYQEANASESYAWVEGSEGHRFYAEPSWPVFRKFLEALDK
jgi:hypothetical protein